MFAKTRPKLLGVLFVMAMVVGSASAATADAARERPWKVDWSGTYEMFGEYPDWCPEGWAPVHMVATGLASHLGAVDMEMAHCANFGTNEIDFGVQVIVAANGDKLYGTYTGFLDPQVTSTNHYEGGTGRFERATGILGPASPWLIPMSETEGLIGGYYTGTISYDASDRSG